MKVWVVGYWIEYEGTQEEELFLKEEKAKAFKAKLQKEHTASYETVYCYEKEVID